MLSATILAGFAFHTPPPTTAIANNKIAKDQSNRPLGENPYQYPAKSKIIPNKISIAPPNTVINRVQDGPSLGIKPYFACS